MIVGVCWPAAFQSVSRTEASDGALLAEDHGAPGAELVLLLEPRRADARREILARRETGARRGRVAARAVVRREAWWAIERSERRVRMDRWIDFIQGLAIGGVSNLTLLGVGPG